jgi:hypothetical protein
MKFLTEYLANPHHILHTRYMSFNVPNNCYKGVVLRTPIKNLSHFSGYVKNDRKMFYTMKNVAVIQLFTLLHNFIKNWCKNKKNLINLHKL